MHIWLYSKSCPTGKMSCVRFPWLLKLRANYTSEIPCAPSFSLSLSPLCPLLLCSFWSFLGLQLCSQYLVSQNEFLASTLLQPFTALFHSTSFLATAFLPSWASNSVTGQDISHTQTQTLQRLRAWVSKFCPSMSGQGAPACGSLILWGEAPSYTLFCFFLSDPVTVQLFCPSYSGCYTLFPPCAPSLLEHSQIQRHISGSIWFLYSRTTW